MQSTGQRAVTVGTSSTVLSRLQPYAVRVQFILTNVSSTQNIYISFGQDAKVNEGIWLAPGGFYIEAMDSSFIPTDKDIYAISDAVGGSIAITERVETRTVI